MPGGLVTGSPQLSPSDEIASSKAKCTRKGWRGSLKPMVSWCRVSKAQPQCIKVRQLAMGLHGIAQDHCCDCTAVQPLLLSCLLLSLNSVDPRNAPSRVSDSQCVFQASRSYTFKKHKTNSEGYWIVKVNIGYWWWILVLILNTGCW